jgi:DNA end-binding protein Ku
MSHALWTGNISFKNINIPVKLNVSVLQNRIQFHLLHKTDMVRLRQQMICAFEKIPVTSKEEVKGFKIDEGKYILMDPEELEEAGQETSRTIEVHEFVKDDEIDPVFMERTYYLEPQSPDKGYRALVMALKETGAQGICTWAMRKRSYLGSIRSNGKNLRLVVLRYSDEIIQAKSLDIESFSLSEKEITIASELINKLTVNFQPDKYINEHQKKLLALIEKKAKGGKFIVFKPRRLKSTAPGKLLEVLEASLKKAN